jgi:hypothetical protein
MTKLEKQDIVKILIATLVILLIVICIINKTFQELKNLLSPVQETLFIKF